MHRLCFLKDLAAMDEKQIPLAGDTREIDLLAVKAMDSDADFERLLTQFEPFLRSQVSKWTARSHSIYDEMMSSAFQAFYEAVKSYDPSKGYFYHLLKNIVQKRLIDCQRKLTANKAETIPLEYESDEEGVSSRPLIDASIEADKETSRRRDLVLEIEEFKEELSKWDLTMDILAKNSPKQAKTKVIYKDIVKRVAADKDIVRVIRDMRYFPIKKIMALTKLPLKTIERARIFTIASIIIYIGDYTYLKNYIEG